MNRRGFLAAVAAAIAGRKADLAALLRRTDALRKYGSVGFVSVPVPPGHIDVAHTFFNPPIDLAEAWRRGALRCDKPAAILEPGDVYSFPDGPLIPFSVARFD